MSLNSTLYILMIHSEQIMFGVTGRGLTNILSSTVVRTKIMSTDAYFIIVTDISGRFPSRKNTKDAFKNHKIK